MKIRDIIEMLEAEGVARQLLADNLPISESLSFAEYMTVG